MSSPTMYNFLHFVLTFLCTCHFPSLPLSLKYVYPRENIVLPSNHFLCKRLCIVTKGGQVLWSRRRLAIISPLRVCRMSVVTRRAIPIITPISITNAAPEPTHHNAYFILREDRNDGPKLDYQGYQIPQIVEQGQVTTIPTATGSGWLVVRISIPMAEA